MPATRMARLCAPLGAAVALLWPGAATAARPSAGAWAVDAVRGQIEARDCRAAVDQLKQGLLKGYPEVELLAGTMYEHGVCVKRDWTQAIALYAQAFRDGEKDAAARLAAGYADPANGPDIAAALWWARRGLGYAFDGCAVSEGAADDPDRFIAELSTWPQRQLAQCNYVAGVMSTISAELRFPEIARYFVVGGEVQLRFLPAVPRIDIKPGDAKEYAMYGVIGNDQLRDRGNRKVAASLHQALGEVADRALRRYPQPAGIDPLMEVKGNYVFSFVYY